MILKFIKSASNAVDFIVGNINRVIATLGIVGGVALAFCNVVARYVFDKSLSWAGELTTYFFIWSAFFGAAYCFKKDAHIAVTVFLEKIPAKWAKSLYLFSHIATLVFLSFVAYYGYEYLQLVIELEETSIDLEIPMWIPYLVIPIAFVFAAFRVLEKIVEISLTKAEDVIPKSEAEMVMEKIGEGEEEVDDKRGYELEGKS
jgi:C4-dicarboxylate transporter DctQ subunit